MRTVAEVIRMGLDHAGLEKGSHTSGMCYLVMLMQQTGEITKEERHAFTDWIDLEIDSWDRHVYLVHLLEDLHCESDYDILYSLWYQWYEEAIYNLNQIGE